MGEVFEANAAEVAGLGVLADSIANDARAATRFLDEQTRPTGDTSGGIMQMLLSPFSLATDFMHGRYNELASTCSSIGIELNRAAWMYADQEKKNYDALNANLQSCLLPEAGADSENPGTGAAEPFPEPSRYVAVESVDLAPPATDAEDIRGLIADSAGWLGDVDDGIKVATGWSPLEEVIKPISGNWNELKRIGDAYKISGEAMEKCGKNLAAGATQVDEHWDGKAAVAFQEYSARQADAMIWEGPVGRVTKVGLERVAEEVKAAIKEAVSHLADMLEEQVQVNDVAHLLKFVLKKVPLAGTTYQGYEIIKIIDAVRDRVTSLVDKIREVVDALAEYLSMIASPSGDLNELSESTLAPITSKVDDVKKKAELVQDIAGVADADGPMHKPTDGFSVGTGRDPWEDAA
ncbi:hypothetical protein [Prescottella agglutinans]|uniref:Uncharacterized protein n=1 Tax=Prescottella agglutinans TaxID=1644129 RepID=A0ABT6MH76_9NOCA|nr:hypothetical protein [Prescottella agglutinans]MDH6283669.1 hypothetical protein [Prescottella agglutinans]